MAVQGTQFNLDLPETFGKTQRVNIHCLKIFEPQDEESGVWHMRLVGGSGVTCYEVSQICNARLHKG